jgi:DNA/RNA endonuclease YhcR with UshA esterase domain
MKRRFLATLIIALVLFLASTPMSAHHSFAAAYDTSKTITIQGVIVQVRLTNPHSWFFLDVKNATTGAVERWAFEAGTPSGMIRNGYKPNELAPGTVVTIQGRPAKDPTQKAGMLQQLTTVDGKTYGMFGPQEGPGAQ